MDNQTNYIWDGSVGVKIEVRTKKETGEQFYSFQLTRCFMRDGSDTMEYSSSFTERNLGQLNHVMQQAIKHMNENPLRSLAA